MVEIVRVRKEELSCNLMFVDISLSASDNIVIKYSTVRSTYEDNLYISRKYIRNGEIVTSNSYWLGYIDVFNISHADFNFKNMIGELNCSIIELDIYYNLYLYLINRIPEQDLRNNISKLFNKDA